MKLSLQEQNNKIENLSSKIRSHSDSVSDKMIEIINLVEYLSRIFIYDCIYGQGKLLKGNCDAIVIFYLFFFHCQFNISFYLQ